MRRAEQVMETLIWGISDCAHVGDCSKECAYYDCCNVEDAAVMAHMPRQLLTDAVMLLLKHPLVHCGQCKHADPYRMTYGQTYCQRYDRIVPLDGYCQEGARKEAADELD